MPRRKGPSLTRADVVRAGRRVVARDGDTTLGINTVARELGIKPPSLYNHIADGDDLRRAVAIDGWRELAERFAAIELTTPDGFERLRDVGRVYRQFAHAEPTLYAVMHAVSLAPVEADFQPIVSAILGIFARALEPLHLSGDAAIHATRALRAALHGFVALEAAGQFRLSANVDESFDAMLSMMLRGLPAPPLPPADGLPAPRAKSRRAKKP